MLQFVILLHNVESTVDANTTSQKRSDGDRFGISSEQYPAKVLSFSLVRKCLSAFRQYHSLDCFFVGVHTFFFEVDRTENVDPWPCVNTQFNSGAS